MLSNLGKKFLYPYQPSFLINKGKNFYNFINSQDFITRPSGIIVPTSNFLDLNIKKVKCRELDVNDNIFKDLKERYQEFLQWFKKIKDRNAFVYKKDDKIKGISIYKHEFEGQFAPCNKQINYYKTLKICTLVVDKDFRKRGLATHLMKKVLGERDPDAYAVYGHLFIKHCEELIPFLKKFGFEKLGKNTRGEELYIKRIPKKGHFIKNI